MAIVRCIPSMAATQAESANDAGSRGPDIIGAIVSTYCIALVALGLPTVARKISKAGFWIDDWLIYASMVMLVSI